VIRHSGQAVICAAWAYVVLAALIMCVSSAGAQDGKLAQQPNQKDFFEEVGRWFDEQAAKINSTLTDTQKKINNLGDHANDVAKFTTQGAKNAADAALRLPNTRVISGHEKCQIATNGAHDCVAAAENLCKVQGFKSGKSLDMTSSETCPPKVYFSGHSSGLECKTETFVARAVCQ
jgi:hypothetical protein